MIVDHLDKRILADDYEVVPNRNGYGDGLVEAGRRDSRVVALSADLTESTRTEQFAEEFPERFIQCGVAEQNMASVASGMAAMGKIPFISSYAMFSPGRNWEQIRTTIAYNNANVKIIGAHAGVSVGPDGATHQAIEDIAIMRVVPNMVVLAPCDVHEARKAVLAAAKYEGPVYIRLARAGTPVITTAESPFEIGKAEYFYRSTSQTGKKILFVTTSTLVHHAIQAAKILEDDGVSITMLHMATVKPLDTETLREAVEKVDVVVTIEEHQKIGGLGGAVAEYVCEVAPKLVHRIGVDDCFGESGEPEELIAHHNLHTEGIVEYVRSVL